MTLRGLAGIAILAIGSIASAHPLPSVSVDVTNCADVDQAVFARLVALELKARPSSADDPALAAQISLRCDGDHVLIDLVDPVTRKRSQRSLASDGVPVGARPRLLSLAVAELVTASWVEAVLFPEPAVRPSTPPAAAEVRLAVIERAAPRIFAAPIVSSLHVGAAAACLGAFGRTGPLCGAGLSAGGDHPHGVAWSSDIYGLHGARAVSVGTIALDAIAIGARIGYAAHLGRTVVRVEAGARGGALRLAGHGSGGVAGHAAWRAFGGPSASLSLSMVATRRVLVDTRFEVGWLAAGARALVAASAGVTTGAALEGAFVLGAIGVSWAP